MFLDKLQHVHRKTQMSDMYELVAGGPGHRSQTSDSMYTDSDVDMRV